MSYVYAPHSKYEPSVDPKKCAASVAGPAREMSFYQCQRKIAVREEGHGWCKQHAPSTDKAREDAREYAATARAGERKYAIRTAERRVVAAAKAWAHNSGPNVRPLYEAVGELERLEAEQP